MSCDDCGGYTPAYVKNCPGSPLEVQLVGGTLPGGSSLGGTDLEVLCDANGDRIFVQVSADETTGDIVYTNPADGSILTAGVDFVPCADCQPKRDDDGLCELLQATVTIDWEVTASGELSLTNPAYSTGDVAFYIPYWGSGFSEQVLGNGPINHVYDQGGEVSVTAVLSDGQNRVAVSAIIDTSQVGATGTMTRTLIIKRGLLREVDCDGVSTHYDCITNAEVIPSGQIVKCDVGTGPSLPIKVSQRCYVDCTANSPRVAWDQSQAWDAGNPLIADAIVDLEAGNPVTFLNVMGSGSDVTITPTGTINSILYLSADEILRVNIGADANGGLDFSYSPESKTVLSIGPIGDGDTFTLSANDNLLVSTRNDLTSIPAVISGSGTPTATVSGIPGDDRTHASIGNVTSLSLDYTNVGPAQNLNLGMWLGGSEEYWEVCEFESGLIEITNSDGASTATAIGEYWHEIECSDVPACPCDPVAGEEVVVGSGFGFDMISGQSGTWTPATNHIVSAFEISVKTVGDVGSPPIFTDSRGIATPIVAPIDLGGSSAEDWGAPSFTNIPTISYSTGDVICVAWVYAETEIV